MIKRFIVASLALAITLASACSSSPPRKEFIPVGPDGKPLTDTESQVRVAQAQVRQFGNDIINLAGGAPPNPGQTSISPVPCSGKVKDFADDGVYYISGGWQVNLDTDRQISTLTAMRDALQSKGYTIKDFHTFEDNGARLNGEDPKTGFTFSIMSTSPPTAIAIGVGTPCIRPPDGKYPAGLGIRE